MTVFLVAPIFSGSSSTTHSHKHGHNQVETSSFKAIPSFSLEVLKDISKGWNIYLTVRNFRFAPENVNKKPIEGEGHAHLYIDGKKISRLYGAWFHVGDLSPGYHTFRVTLNGNDHSELMLYGKRIEKIKKVKQ